MDTAAKQVDDLVTRHRAQVIASFLAAASVELAILSDMPDCSTILPFTPEQARAVLGWLGGRLMTGKLGQ
jgi:hypothetical protein